MDTIFLLLESPPDLIIAVRLREPGYDFGYTLISAEYAQTEMDRIEASDQFEEIPVEKVDPLLDSIYEWRRKENGHRSHVRRVLVHKVKGGSFD